MTSAPPSARILAKVVPQLPAPSTATRLPGPRRGGLAIEAPRLLLAVLRGIPALRGSLFAAQLGEERGDGVHELARCREERRLVEAAIPVLGEVERLADDHVDGLAR